MVVRFNILYPLGDAVLIAITWTILRHGGGKVKKCAVILSLGLLAQIAADIVFTYQTPRELYWNGGLADSLWALAGFLLSLAIINLYNNFTDK